MAAREDCREDPIQDFALPHDALTDLRQQVLVRIGEALEQFDVAGNRGRGTGDGGRV